ncbi:MAG: type II and III secretion system protein [Desulfobulbaceae bacterium]|uniref:Type II and III secretion system protein n=1 Tax=Candidatus Desulfobia pelagia TaxID=2841692 RepID=A0A8J6NDX3_9BACT|nr:type II and III secretion system protein [Candidatus Desulfobia pelagia]
MKRKTFCLDSGVKSAFMAENQTHRKSGDRLSSLWLSALLLLSLFISGCMATNTGYQQSQQQAQQFIDKHTAGALNAETFDGQAIVSMPVELPTRFQNSTFLLDEMETTSGFDDAITIPIGADISSNTGPVALREIMKRLAVLKGMNVSWESDVDQGALVDVDIRAEDDYFESIDNMLRQLDYFHEVNGNSLIVKYRQSKVYHLALPYMTPTYEISVGGDVLGGGSNENATDLEGSISLKSKGRDDQVFDVWKNIENNLAEILSLYEETSRLDTLVLTDSDTNESQGDSAESKTEKTKKSKESTTELARTKSKGALGQVTYDRPLGIITVTAPRGVLERTDSYFINLKKELYRQVMIEAKIVEVELTENNRTGINWDSLLSMADFNFHLDFQKLNPYLIADKAITEEKRFLTLDDKNFTLLLDLIEDQGHTEILANPKITVMNGQPALINVGESIQYVSEIIQTVSDNGTVTVTPTTAQVFSGLGLGVIANIVDDEVILNLTPIESEVTDWNEEIIGGNTLTLPTVSVREMNTQVRVKSNDILVIGGLISSIKDYEESGIKGLRKLAFGSKMFKQDGVDSRKRELVIMLRPVIQNFGDNK